MYQEYGIIIFSSFGCFFFVFFYRKPQIQVRLYLLFIFNDQFHEFCTRATFKNKCNQNTNY